jgi:hypothetical protein
VTIKWENIWTHEEVETENWGIFNETSFTGHIVLSGLGEEAAKFYADLMNEVYNQIKKDFNRIQEENTK